MGSILRTTRPDERYVATRPNGRVARLARVDTADAAALRPNSTAVRAVAAEVSCDPLRLVVTAALK